MVGPLPFKLTRAFAEEPAIKTNHYYFIIKVREKELDLGVKAIHLVLAMLSGSDGGCAIRNN